jgi:hypothetical protein
VERGTHAELLSLDGAYARLYHEQYEPTAGVPVDGVASMAASEPLDPWPAASGSVLGP